MMADQDHVEYHVEMDGTDGAGGLLLFRLPNSKLYLISDCLCKIHSAASKRQHRAPPVARHGRHGQSQEAREGEVPGREDLPGRVQRAEVHRAQRRAVRAGDRVSNPRAASSFKYMYISLAIRQNPPQNMQLY